MQPQPAAAAASRSSLRGEREQKKKENVQLASSRQVQAPDRFPRRWVSEVPLALFSGGRAPGEKLADSDRKKQPFGMLPGEVTQGRQTPAGRHTSRPVRGRHRELSLAAQRFQFLPGVSLSSH